LIDFKNKYPLSFPQRSLPEIHPVGVELLSNSQDILINPPDNLSAETYYRLGRFFDDRGEPGEAFRFFQKAVELDPTLVAAYNDLGAICQGRGQIKEAVQFYQKALSLHTNFAEANYNLANAYKELGQWPEVVHYSKRAIELDPGLPEASYILGIAFYELDQLEEAIRCWQRTLQLNPGHQDAYNNLGVAFQDKHELKKAQTCFQKVIQNNPDFSEAHWNKSLCHLLAGSFSEGWNEYQWRFQIKEIFNNRHFSQPLWEGGPLLGKKILLYAEQGLGDTIQFIRYIPLVVKQGGRVLVECQEDLVSLLESIEGIELLIKQGQPLPGFDVQCPLLNLPLNFKMSLEDIPASIPYLSVNPALIEKWRDLLASDRADIKIGLVWAGRPTHKKDRKRSLSLEAFDRLSDLPGITYYSLQKGEAAQQLRNISGSLKPINVSEKLVDFTETGALIENLDLIITVDTAVAHLAGALGKPVWTLLPYSPDWRWLLDREDSPWYPSMRLFRQPSPGDWDSVIHSVHDCLLKITK
jgi:tetratricopeptide (TPR) repeat protein